MASSAKVNLPWSGQQTVSIRDSFIIWRDTHDAGYTGNGTVFFGNGLWKTAFYNRGKNWAICSGESGDTANVANGYISLDGVQVPYTTSVPEGFHLLSFAPTNTTQFILIANQNNGLISLGGCSVGEIMVFSNELPRVVHKYVAAKLMKRWFGKNMMTNVVDVGSLTFGNGGTFKVSKNAEADGTAVVCTTLAGDGTVEADRVDGIASLAFAFQSRTAVDQIEVDGTATFAEDVTVTLTVPAGVKPAAGEYVLFSADSLANVDLSRWTLNVANPKNRGYQLKRDGEAIILCVTTPGLSVLIR